MASDEYYRRLQAQIRRAEEILEGQLEAAAEASASGNDVALRLAEEEIRRKKAEIQHLSYQLKYKD